MLSSLLKCPPHSQPSGHGTQFGADSTASLNKVALSQNDMCKIKQDWISESQNWRVSTSKLSSVTGVRMNENKRVI